MGLATKPDFAAATDALELPIIFLATDIRVAGFNPAAARLLGLTPSHVGRSFRTIDALAGMIADIEELAEHVTAGGAAVQREIRTPDGAWFVLRAAPNRGADGPVTGVVLTLTNVTAFRASVEQAIYEREYTKAILNTVIDPLVVLDGDLRVQTANKAFHSLFQLSRDDVQGTMLAELGKGEWNIPQLVARLRGTLVAGSDEIEPLEVDLAVPTLGRRTVIFNARKLARPGRRADLILLTAEDITDRRRAERAIRERTAQFEILLSEAPLGVYLVDDEFRIRAVNPTARPVFGDIPDLIGRDFGEVIHTLWPKDFADEIVARFRNTLETGEPYVVPETAEERRDRGATEYYQWRINRIPLPDDRRGVVCYFRDISAEVTTREALAENERRLREESDRKDEFLATLAHELRNPLMPVRMTLTRMRRHPVQSPDGRQLDMIDRQVKNLERIVDDLLEVARISSGKIELKKERVDLIVAINHALESARDLIKQRKHDVSLTVPMGPVVVAADPVRIEQILTNLLINAAKYTHPGGKIWVSLERASGHVEIRVRDAGIGISPDLLPRVFEMFEQGRRDLARSTGGLGIGLSIVKKLAELHGGSVVAESAGIDKGSEFTVRLPAQAEDGVALPVTSQKDRRGISSSARRILVVDDNADAAESFADLLKEMGHEVRIANDGRAALEMNRQWPAEIIFLDIGLPGMDGYEVARRIRVQNDTTRLVALTGYGHESARSMSVEAGFVRHLVKPPDIDAVVAVLDGLAAAEERPLN